VGALVLGLQPSCHAHRHDAGCARVGGDNLGITLIHWRAVRARSAIECQPVNDWVARPERAWPTQVATRHALRCAQGVPPRRVLPQATTLAILR
jgi:hypothetical protein